MAVAALLAVALLVAACSGDDAGSNGAQSSGGSEAGSSDGGSRDPAEAADRDAEFRFAMNFGFNSFDPHRSPAPSAGQIYMRQVYDSLLTIARTEDGLELAPQLATSFEIAEDGMSVEFELRDDVTFQDGTPFDANAVKANIERALGPGSTVVSLISSIASVEVVDPTHVVFHLKSPDPSVPWAMATGTNGMMVSPAAMNNPDLATNPVGAGPFTLVSATKDAEVVYERWDDYWNPDATLVARLTITTISDGNARLNATRSGEYDAAYLTAPQDQQAKSLTSEDFHWQSVLSSNSSAVLLHTGKAPFDDVRVRRAVSMAVNRPEMSETLMHGLRPPMYQPFPEGFLGYDDSLDENPYDLDAARDLIEEAGAEGATVSMLQILGIDPEQSIATVLQQTLNDIGLNVELVPLSATEVRPAWLTGRYHAMAAPIVGRSDPSITLQTSYLGGDNLGPPPPELVEMAEDALVMPMGSTEREKAYQKISAYLVENPIHVPLAQFSSVLLARPEVIGSEKLMVTGIADVGFSGVGIARS